MICLYYKRKVGGGGKSGHHIDECLHSDSRTFQGPLKLFSCGYTNPTKR